MKLYFCVLSATLLAATCNNIPKTTTITTDKAEVAEVKTSNAANNTMVSSSRDMTSESDNPAKAKKGWSKTAKGAVIGGVVGAGTGAVVNKKNRVAGAVVGGAVGAGAGAIIGHELDKKDGRH